MSDFPPGWQETPPAPKDPALDREVLTCLRAPHIAKNRTADITSPAFTQKSTSGTVAVAASSETTFKATRADAVNDYLAVSTVPAGRCVQTALQKLVERELSGIAESVSVDAGSVEPPPTGGNPGVAFNATVNAQINGQKTPIAQGTVVIFFRGRKEMVVTSLGLGDQSFPPDLFTNLLSAVAGRANSSQR